MKQDKNNDVGHAGKNTNNNENCNRTHTSKGTLSENYGKILQLKNSVWFIGFVTTLAVFTMSKTGRENIKKVITDFWIPASIPYGSIVVNEEEGTKYGAKATVVCSHGYSSSKPEAVCQANGKWSSVYCHVTDCSYPKIEHGHLEWYSTLFLSQATVKCDTGYSPRQPHVTCTASGTWQNAVCYNIDDCANNPCQNGGQCEDKVADYVCKCQRWYSGKNCELDTRCANHQCKNGGSCVPQPNGSYKCSCPPGIDGIFCESPHKH